MKEVNGTSYHDGTPDQVISWLETSRSRKQRIRIFYGDTVTGKAWEDENDVIGHVGRSTGREKVPLLIHSMASHGGCAILDDCIIRIDTKGSDGTIRTVYSHPTFNNGTWEVRAEEYEHHDEARREKGTYKAAVYHDGKLYARAITMDKATALKLYMEGFRWRK